MPAPTGPQGRCLLVPMRLEPRLPGPGHSRCFPHACGTRAGTRQWGVGGGLAPRPLWMPRGKELGAQLQTEEPPGPGGGGRPDSRPGIHLLSLAPSPTTSEGLTACLPSFLPPFPHQHPAHSCPQPGAKAARAGVWDAARGGCERWGGAPRTPGSHSLQDSTSRLEASSPRAGLEGRGRCRTSTDPSSSGRSCAVSEPLPPPPHFLPAPPRPPNPDTSGSG